jgi:hypothetical protein
MSSTPQYDTVAEILLVYKTAMETYANAMYRWMPGAAVSVRHGLGERVWVVHRPGVYVCCQCASYAADCHPMQYILFMTYSSRDIITHIPLTHRSAAVLPTKDAIGRPVNTASGRAPD